MFAEYEWIWNLTNSTARHLASLVDTHCVIVYMTVSDQQWDTSTVHSWMGVCTVCTLGWSWCRGHREWLCCARSYGTRCVEWPGVWQFCCWFRCCYWSCAIGSPETISCNRPKPPSADWSKQVQDISRVEYLQGYLSQMHKAMSQGVDVKGYLVTWQWCFAWSQSRSGTE